MLIDIHNQEGKKTGELNLPKEIFDKKINPDLIHQVITVLQKNQRLHWAHTKDRGEVRGGGKKPWRQKGTGRARHGSIRSPLWKGGGVTFGPTKDKNLKKKINKKMASLSLLGILQDKIVNHNLVVVENLSLEEPKTKKLISFLRYLLGEKTINSVALITQEVDKNLKLASRNIKKLSLLEARNINSLMLIKYKKIIITKQALQELIKKIKKS